jgi:tetratricopeptide (TPR) repeat protein
MGLLAQRATRQQMKADQEAQFMAGMFEAATPEEAQGRTITARDLLDRGALRVDHDLASEPEVRAAMLNNIGSAYRSLGLSDQAQVYMQRAYDLRKRILGANAPASLQTFEALAELQRDAGQFARAEAMLRQVLAAR